MKQILLSLIIAFALASCSSDPSTTTTVAVTDSLKENLLEPNSIDKIVAAHHAKLTGLKGDPASFKKYIADLEKEKIPAINGFISISIVPLAFDYINTCIPANENGDSVFYYFNKLFYTTVDRLSDSLYTPAHDSLATQIDENRQTPGFIAFKQNLASCGMIVALGEGEYYVTEDPDFFYNNFKNRVSKGLSAYLQLNVNELKEGFAEDGGLVISFEEVYKRAKNWETFLADYPHSFAEREATHLYAMYMETLLNGMDNSPIFDDNGHDSTMLLPEVKALYEKIATEEPENRSSKLVTAYYKYLARDNFRRTESTGEFIANSELDSMLAIEPHLR